MDLNPRDGALSPEDVKHLIKRLTFGLTRDLYHELYGKTAEEAVQLLLDVEMPSGPEERPRGANLVYFPDNGHEIGPHDVRKWDLGLKYTDNTIREKLAWFFHSIFVISTADVTDTRAIYYYLQTIKKYIVNDLQDNADYPKFNRYHHFAKKMGTDNAIGWYLDGRSNLFYRNRPSEGQIPNENLAREFFELFTIGVGRDENTDKYINYTEDDIKEAARIFSGWYPHSNYEWRSQDNESGIPRTLPLHLWHFWGPKTFSEKFGGVTINSHSGESMQSMHDEMDQLVAMIYGQIEASRFLMRKLYRFFVHHDITDEIEQDIIEPLAQEFKNNGLHLRPILIKLFTSNHFYDAGNGDKKDNKYGSQIKSPLDFVMGTLRFFKSPTLQIPKCDTSENAFHFGIYMNRLIFVLQDQSMNYMRPADVAGYPAYYKPGYSLNWITTNSLAKRYDFIRILLNTNNDLNLLYGANTAPEIYIDPLNFILNVDEMPDEKATQEKRVEVNGELIGVAYNLVDHYLSWLLPEKVTEERANYFGYLHSSSIATSADSTPFNSWRYQWAHKDDSEDVKAEVEGALKVLFNAIMQSPEYQIG